jgi:hypothetical protein
VLAPLWDNLNTLDPTHDIFVDTVLPGRVVFRWLAANSEDGGLVNVAVTLFSNGDYRFDYGEGNDNVTPEVGFTLGNQLIYREITGYHQAPNLGLAPSVQFQRVPGFTDIGAYEFRGSSLDVTPPAILQTFFTVTGNPGSLLSQIQVTFTEVINSIDAAAVANYELRDDGGNGIFGDAGDTVYGLVPHYTPGTTLVLLDVIVAGGGLLPTGKYQLTVSGSTTVHDLSGLALDGDGDGQEGGDFVLGNQSPVLGPIADRTVNAGQVLSFIVTATDADAPAQALRFRLGDGAPAGAGIDPETGLFTWATLLSDVQAFYDITVVVTDDGVPALTDARTFRVFVNAAPRVEAVVINGGLVQRSRVTSLAWTFNDDVSATLGLNDLTLTLRETGEPVSLAGMILAFDSSARTATLSFEGLPGGALEANGHYRLTIVAAGVVDPQGVVMGSDAFLDFHVLTGDANGDGFTNDLDLYRVWRNGLRLVSDLNDDLNGDGMVDHADLDVVTGNYLALLPVPGPLLPAPSGAGEWVDGPSLTPVEAEAGAVEPERAASASMPDKTPRESGVEAAAIWTDQWAKRQGEDSRLSLASPRGTVMRFLSSTDFRNASFSRHTAPGRNDVLSNVTDAEDESRRMMRRASQQMEMEMEMEGPSALALDVAGEESSP